MGGKVLVPTQEAIITLVAARLAADVCGVPTVLVARTDADSAELLTSDVDERDRAVHRRVKGRTAEGFFYRQERRRAGDRARPRLRALRGPALVRDRARPTWRRRASSPRASTRSSRASCSPTTARRPSTGRSNLDDATIAKFQRELGAMGYKFQFVTLAGFHALNYAMFELARGYKARQMAAYGALQQAEFAAETHGYTATKHQREVGTGYFDAVTQAVSGGTSSITALSGSTEEQQFHKVS